MRTPLAQSLLPTPFPDAAHFSLDNTYLLGWEQPFTKCRNVAPPLQPRPPVLHPEPDTSSMGVTTTEEPCCPPSLQRLPVLADGPGTPAAALPHGSASLPAAAREAGGRLGKIWHWAATICVPLVGGGAALPRCSPEATGTSWDRWQRASDFIRLGSKAKQNPQRWQRARGGTHRGSRGRGGIAADADIHLLQLSGEGGKVHYLIWSFEGRFLPPAPHRVLAHIHSTWERRMHKCNHEK